MTLKIFRRGQSFAILGTSSPSIATNVLTFNPIYSQLNIANEVNSHIELIRALIIQHMGFIVATNTKDQDTIIAFRDDIVSVVTITVGAGLIGRFETTVAVTIALGSLVNFLIDTTASTVGTITARPINVQGVWL